MKDVHSPLTAALRLIGLALWAMLMLPLFIACRSAGRSRPARAVERLIYRGLVRLCGFRLDIVGHACALHPVLYVANHCSYFDILVLGSRLDACFVAKKEVRSWPVIGALASLAGTVFIERHARHSRTQRDAMKSRLAGRRESLVLFPEGTSSDGLTVLPFKSALFSVAETATGDGPLAVQPVSLAYTRLDGMPLGRAWRPHFAWYGDMDLASHIWIALGLGRVTVTVIFHPPVSLDQCGTRKALADYCRETVKRGVILANRGRAALTSPS